MLLCPWDFPGKSTGVGCHFLLQGIFLTQASNPGLLHCRQTLLPSEPPREVIEMLLLLLSHFSRVDSVQPHRRQPTRLPRPWDSPGKNTGVGCHFLFQYMKVKSEVKSLSRVRLLVTPWAASTRLLHPWDFPGKSTGVGCHCLVRL